MIPSCISVSKEEIAIKKIKWYRQPAALLLILLFSSALAVAAIGFGLKFTLGRSNEQIQNTLAIAVPFVLMQGQVPLDLGAEDPVETEDPTPPVIEEDPNPGIVGEDEPEPEPEPEPAQSVFAPVDDAYFDTALFIGDSRTVGLSQQGRLGKADYFADVGMSLFNLFDKTISDKNFKNQTLRGLLGSKQYKTIYIMLGINEVGYPLNSIEKKLQTTLDEIKTLQPNAMIILQANLMVTQDKATRNQTFSLEKMRALNAMIARYADAVRVHYLDVNPYFTDENGYLRPDVTGDGTHPFAAEYKKWSEWIRDHALVPNT